MELGPISAIRPVSMVRPSPHGSETNPDVSGVFAAEFRDQQRDDAYSSERGASRGLEDENEPEPDEPAPGQADSSVSFFA